MSYLDVYRNASIFGLCRYAPPDPDPDDDDDKDKGKGGGGGEGGDGEKDLAYWKAEAEKWKGLSRKHETDSKKNAEAAKKLEELENANKSELEKAQAKAEQSDKDAATARTELLRTRVALKKGLTEVQARRLVGTTEEELETDAEELLTTFKPQADPEDGDRSRTPRPRENLRNGAKPDTKPEEMDPGKLAEAVPR